MRGSDALSKLRKNCDGGKLWKLVVSTLSGWKVAKEIFHHRPRGIEEDGGGEVNAIESRAISKFVELSGTFPGL